MSWRAPTISPSRPTSGDVDGSNTMDSVGGSICDRVEGDGVLGVGVDVADIGALDADDGSDVARFNDVAFLAAKVVEGEQLANRRSRLGAVVLHDEESVARMDGYRNTRGQCRCGRRIRSGRSSRTA